MTNSRTKGRAGEQEVARILRDELRLEVRRNWEALAASGLAFIHMLAPTSKRAKVLRLSEWWTQTAGQALRAHARPVLIYRLDRHPWYAMMSLYNLRPDIGDHRQVTMLLESWCKLVRIEELDADP